MAKSAKRYTPKYIFVVGGVMSSVGKGIAASSLAMTLQSRGYRVTAMKADPYINVDAGTMNPTEHGEVFVTADGDETDQDIGNYERFLHQDIHKVNYMTTGRVYLDVIQQERNLQYEGKCVEVVPHIPLNIISRIKKAQKTDDAEITVIEIGGTVGEYQSALFLEAARMMKNERPDDVAIVMVSYLPVPSAVGEMKTKPTQTAVRQLNEAGLQADFIIARSEKPIDAVRKEKLSVFCAVKPERVIAAPNCDTIYAVPQMFEDEDFSLQMLKLLKLKSRRVTGKTSLQRLNALVNVTRTAEKKVKIAVVGKYFNTGEFVLSDVYISVIEALKHAAWGEKHEIELTWIDAEVYEKNPKAVKELSDYDGVLVPGGFGSRAIEGKITAIQYVREKKIPYFGLCYGMQLACIELARHKAGLNGAHTVEIDQQTDHPIIIVNPNQQKNIRSKQYGGTLRLGSYDCDLKAGTKTAKAYGAKSVVERHRHRYEFNNEYMEQLEKAGLIISGVNPQQGLVEIIELKDHPWFVGTQFHPEFLSRPLTPHPLFVGFIKASINNQ
jgi:CTP synthase